VKFCVGIIAITLLSFVFEDINILELIGNGRGR